MPPHSLRLRGRADVPAFLRDPGRGCHDSRPVPLTANGMPAFGQYRAGGVPWALQVVEITDGRITGLTSFLDTERLFPLFGLPPRDEA
ncbi:hypothetical protein SNOUR_24995 [Streptomyces noursei ATCC 11455]|uniref:hypothetical protein n=1 Tax=Streptomyces noursei TaxID=1971 RepID=UPI00081C9FF0|nr:hypothetical protein SNOUR_24995 [Streptomyces noursei ATCC 11455]